ncbi:MAG: stage 0 sporulation family protein [Fibrobacterota bacterium]
MSQTDKTEKNTSDSPDKKNDIVEVQFKGNRKHYYLKPSSIKLFPGEYVKVEVDRGIDIGRVSLTGHLVGLKKVSVEDFKIITKASRSEISELMKIREEELKMASTCRGKIKSHGLKMKLVDAEMRFDKSKLTFYFTADQRVDFRQLVKDLASEYRTRIELRQIGVRDEARRMGGVGICGCDLCCTTHIKDFAHINTQMAKEQNLSLNPQKISGNCGRLLCCLKYELPFYKKAYGAMPAPGSRYKTESGTGTVKNVDIFKNMITVRHQDGLEEKVTPSKGNKNNE